MFTDSVGLGALGFWLFVAAAVIATSWSAARQKAEKHETLRRIVEKTGSIDEALLKEVFKEEPADEWTPDRIRRALRIYGTIIMFVGAGLALFFLIPTLLGDPIDWWFGGLAVSAGVAIVGLGVFFSSRFAGPPAR